MSQDDSAQLLEELWSTIFSADTDCSEDEEIQFDHSFGSGEHGYERDAQQRRADCHRVKTILQQPNVSPDLRCRHGMSLLYHSLVYDHRHGPEMLKVVLDAGAGVNEPTHLGLSELPLDCELWLELEGPFAHWNRAKQALLIANGAEHSPAVAMKFIQEVI